MAPLKERSLFGKVLEEYRVQRGISTQTELSRKLNDQGYNLHVSTVNKYESGERRPPPSFILAVTKCLGLNDDQRDALFNGLLTDVILELIEAYRKEVAAQDEEKTTRISDSNQIA